MQRAEVGPESQSAITSIRDEQGELETGNVLRRLCEFAGVGACKQSKAKPLAKFFLRREGSKSQTVYSISIL